MMTITPTSARGSPAKKIKDSKDKAYSTHAPDETGHACFLVSWTGRQG